MIPFGTGKQNAVFQLYVRELCRNTKSAIELTQAMLARAHGELDPTTTNVDEYIHILAERIMFHTDSVRRIIFSEAVIRKKNFAAHSVRLNRTKIFQDIFKDLSLVEIKKQGARNKFAHFDEYVDEILGDLQTIDAFVYYNLSGPSIASARRMFPTFRPLHKHIRFYHTETKNYIHFDEVVNMGILLEELTSIESTLKSVLGEDCFNNFGIMITLDRSSA